MAYSTDRAPNNNVIKSNTHGLVTDTERAWETINEHVLPRTTKSTACPRNCHNQLTSDTQRMPVL